VDLVEVKPRLGCAGHNLGAVGVGFGSRKTDFRGARKRKMQFDGMVTQAGFWVKSLILQGILRFGAVFSRIRVKKIFGGGNFFGEFANFREWERKGVCVGAWLPCCWA